MAKSWQIRFPGGMGGIVWNRPHSVVVQSPEGEDVLPVRDVTRQVQLALLGSGLTGVLLVGLILKMLDRRRED
jgi:hypothetical protein